MSKTKQEIRDFLRSKVGKTVPDLNNRALDGQCVAYIKALLDFVGAKDPYKPRGNAKDVGDSYLRDGIAKNGKGWLQICVNRTMGGGYGHVWVDLMGETNFEQNGAQAKKVTEGTRPYSQAQQIVNLDAYVREDAPAASDQLPAGVIPQTGTYKIEVNNLIVRTAPQVSPETDTGVRYMAGEQVNAYQGYIDANGYRWVCYKARSGNWRYVARRSLDGKEVFGHCF